MIVFSSFTGYYPVPRNGMGMCVITSCTYCSIEESLVLVLCQVSGVKCQDSDASYWSSQVDMEELAPSPTKVMDDLHSVRTFRPEPPTVTTTIV